MRHGLITIRIQSSAALCLLSWPEDRKAEDIQEDNVHQFLVDIAVAGILSIEWLCALVCGIEPTSPQRR